MDPAAVEAAIQQLEAQKAQLSPEVLALSITALRRLLGPLPGAPELRRVAVLFLAVDGLPNRPLWDQIGALIVREGGRVEQQPGNTLMAVWGLGGTQDDETGRAIRTALGLRQTLREGARPGAEAAGFRIGLHAGGLDGGLAEMVCWAGRLERACPDGGILVSEEAYRRTRGLFDLSPQAPLVQESPRSELRTFLVLAAKARALLGAQRVPEGRESPFVGRQSDLEVLQASFRETSGRGQRTAVTVGGEPGIGKSRLVKEFEDWTDLQPDRCWLFQGRCDPPFEHSPWALVRGLLATRFGIAETPSGPTPVERLEAGLAELWTPAKAAEAAPWIAALVGWKPDHRLTSDSQILRDRALGYLEDWWSELALRHPLFFLLEDLHWADDASLGGLEAILDRLVDRPVLLVASSRPGLWERRPDWASGRTWHRRLNLRPLSATETGALVSSLIEGEVWSRLSLVDALVDRAGGNPFFAEELVHAWRESGDEKLDRLRLPSTLTGVLDSRLARLSPAARRLVQQAAVVGQTFWRRAVDAVEGRPWAPETWDELVKADLIVRRATSLVAGADEWQFRHSLIRQAVLDGGLRTPPRNWHGAVAGWLAGMELSDGPSREAPHWEAAGEDRRAAEAYRRALAAARATRAAESAIQAADGALRLGGWTRKEAFDLGLERCRALEEASLFDRLKTELDALEPEARALGGEAFGAWFLEVAAFASVFSEFGRVDDLWKAPEMARVPEPVKVKLLDRYIKTLVVNRRLRDAEPLVARYEALELGSPWAEAKRDSTLGLYETFLGVAKRKGIDRSLEATRQFLELGDDYQALLASINMLTFLTPAVARDEVWPNLEKLNRRVREPYLWGIGLFNYGMLLFRHGFLDQGLDKVTQSLRYEPPLDTGRCESLTFLALHGWLSGNQDQAALHRKELREFAEATANQRGTGLACQLEGIASVEAGRYAEGAAFLTQAQGALTAQGDTINALVTQAWLSRALEGAGERDRARSLAAETAGQVLAFEALSELSFPYMVYAPLAGVLATREPETAQALVRRALVGMEEVRSHIGDAQAEAVYLGLPFHRELRAWAGEWGMAEGQSGI